MLYRGARVLILDEPTAVLVPQEVDDLFASLAGLRAEGLAVLFISHKLDEVLRVADTVTVLRQGTTVTTVDPASVTPRQLAELMVGSALPSPETRESTVTDVVELAVEHLTVRSPEGRVVVDDVSLRVRRGEVVGIAGVEGNGQVELVEALLGLRAATGTVRLGDRDLAGLSTRQRREGGIGYVPEDRHRQGLLLSAPLWENRVLGHQGRSPSRKGLWIDRRAARADTERIVREYGVKTPGRRRAGLRAVRRQPAEARRRPRDVRRRRRCWSPATRPAGSTSARRPRSGTSCAPPAATASPSCSSRPTSRS